MNDFIKRNLPVFIIGGITAIVFILIIVVSQTNEEDSLLPGLIRVDEQELEPGDPGPDLEFEETETPITEMTPAQIDRMIKEKELGDREGSYADSVSLLPGNPVDEAIQEQAKELEAKVYMTPEEVKQAYGEFQVRYTQNGFEPRKSSAYQYQVVVWLNETSDTLVLEQRNALYNELEQPVILQPGESFRFEVYKEGNLRFTNAADTYYFGTLNITRAKR